LAGTNLEIYIYKENGMRKELIDEYLDMRQDGNTGEKYQAMSRQIKNSLRRKRAFDIVIIVLSLPFLIPLFLVVSLVIRMDSRGNTFYFSKRIGRDGKEFNFFKFRTMIPSAEFMKGELLSKNESSEGITFKMKNDPRVTRVGAYLRKYSIDELPQLINVLLGDMSLVGPRPPIASEVAEYSLSDFKRLHVTPGLTCIWQISGRSEIPFNKQVEMDLDYIKNYKLTGDLKILLKTIPAVVKGSGAY
jgi:lipopolysaccharide/colanic/teichoic acid biosynthesis glycosyltransferase